MNFLVIMVIAPQKQGEQYFYGAFREDCKRHKKFNYLHAKKFRTNNVEEHIVARNSETLTFGSPENEMKISCFIY